MKKLFSTALVSIVAVSLLSSPAHAAPLKPDTKTEKKLLYRPLSAAVDSKIVLDSIEVCEEDGIQHVRVGQTRPANGQLQSYTIDVDLETDTYTAKLTPKSEISPEFSAKKEIQSLPLLAVKDYYAYVTAQTLDPINVLCNTTTLGWGWSENRSTSGSAFSYRWRSLSYWDAQPTPFGTYWYYVKSGYSNDPSGAHQGASSTHVNYDFLGGLAGTTHTKHDLSIASVKNAKYHYDVELTTDGDVGYFLHLGIESR